MFATFCVAQPKIKLDGPVAERRDALYGILNETESCAPGMAVIFPGRVFSTFIAVGF